ncbi:alpha-amylase family glycosyl hydrolase [Luteolibacter soli]|uniref:Alpha-amylase family glycosyl hydrolase n=1 Tax=Luteolibacter soli TaxID=3135280 RepID=A0ABU9B251_9BACT
MRCLAVLLLTLLSANARPWTDDVLYFVLTDRFHDGDPANNTPAGSDPLLYDPLQKNIGMYQGGDLRGLEQAIESGYFTDLGVTALWITPPVKNVWRSGYDLGGWKTGYHGYWAQDFLDIDPHLTSAVSMKGEKYPDGAEGRMRHYRDFVALAHSKGLKVVQDVVLNHAGPVFFYDVNGNGAFDNQAKEEWVQPFKRDGFYPNAMWMDIAKWNLEKAQPDGPRELLGKRIATKGVLADLSSYGRKGFSSDSLGKSDGEEIECDFFSLRDLWTAPDSDHFDRLVNEFVEIYAFYLLNVGVDGLRIDTVKHVHHEFWDAFTERLRKRLGAKAKDKLLFGEVYDGDPKKLGVYTWRSDAPARKEPCLDSVLDFQTCFAAREYLRHEGGEYGSAAKLERAMKAFRGAEGDRPYYNPNPGPDGKNAREKSVTFIENHDGLNRFRVAGVTAERNDLAQALVMTLPGIPCIYYGAEVALHDTKGKVGQDTESGRLTLFPREAEAKLSELKEEPSFKVISRAAALRAELPVLRDGEFRPLWVDSPQSGEDDGVFAFCREKKDGKVIVVFNAAAEPRTPKLPAADFPAGTKLGVTPVCGTSPVSQATVGPDERVEVALGPNTAVILQRIVEPVRAK